MASPPASVEEIARLRDQIARTPDNLKDAAVALNELRLENAALLSDRAAMVERVAGLEALHRSVTTKLKATDRRAIEAEAEVARLREALEKIERRIETANKRGEVFLVRPGDKAATLLLATLEDARAALTRPDEPTKET